MIRLPELPYAYEALQPTISSETMHTHHDKHHAKYVETVNQVVGELGLDGKSLEDILAEAERRSHTKLINNAGQAWNHAFFWDCMTPERRDPTGEIVGAIQAAFGDLAGLKTKFVQAGVDHFGSGWVWLAADGGQLSVTSTHDGGTLATQPQTPLLVCDLWEHAYYLDYKQDRKSFLETWFDRVADWEFAEAQFAAAQGRQQAWSFQEAA
ncbi:superoxide dismutase [Fe] [Phenylobacterium hankyongense]|uniref:Superoxide dismutase n=1 Tax=Phenylobacterium hankyongense TaxID=1813876 RepID=A0A328AWL1_9CAUL|nr:superoxide dismutase [Phenylobacterium hankyongense]RAK59019.1 superoxide dismutase [Fe] [Phenylobacterium hankyongense]